MTPGIRQQICDWCYRAGRRFGHSEPLILEAVAIFTVLVTADDTPLPMTYEPRSDLYDVARRTCHNNGIEWIDPRTGWRFPPPGETV